MAFKLLPLVILGTVASPLLDSRELYAGGFVRNINRSIRQGSPVANKTGALRIFDPTYAVRLICIICTGGKNLQLVAQHSLTSFRNKSYEVSLQNMNSPRSFSKELAWHLGLISHPTIHHQTHPTWSLAPPQTTAQSPTQSLLIQSAAFRPSMEQSAPPSND
jgi:hypothetical protein